MGESSGSSGRATPDPWSTPPSSMVYRLMRCPALVIAAFSCSRQPQRPHAGRGHVLQLGHPEPSRPPDRLHADDVRLYPRGHGSCRSRSTSEGRRHRTSSATPQRRSALEPASILGTSVAAAPAPRDSPAASAPSPSRAVARGPRPIPGRDVLAMGCEHPSCASASHLVRSPGMDRRRGRSAHGRAAEGSNPDERGRDRAAPRRRAGSTSHGCVARARRPSGEPADAGWQRGTLAA